jgi:hypothetical protein
MTVSPYKCGNVHLISVGMGQGCSVHVDTNYCEEDNYVDLEDLTLGNCK